MAVYGETLYLNNDGSRWKFYDDNPDAYVVVQYPDGSSKTRKVDFWASWGNFSYCQVRFRGVAIKLCPIGKSGECSVVTLTEEHLKKISEKKARKAKKADKEAWAAQTCREEDLS